MRRRALLPVHEGGTPVVRAMKKEPAIPPPSGPPLYAGDPKVLEDWHHRARRDRAMFRVLTFGAVIIGGALMGSDLSWGGWGLLLIAVGLVLYPLSIVDTQSRTAQKPFEIFEEGVWATERRPFLRFRRFARWPDIVNGEARQLRPGKVHLTLSLLDGSVVSSIPGELSPEAVEYVHARTGEQVRWIGERPAATV